MQVVKWAGSKRAGNTAIELSNAGSKRVVN